jgi:hypothetical protein
LGKYLEGSSVAGLIWGTAPEFVGAEEKSERPEVNFSPVALLSPWSFEYEHDLSTTGPQYPPLQKPKD